LTADINKDGVVNFGDFAILASQWLETDMSNSVAVFDGSTGFVTVPDNAALNLGTGDFTICFWVKTTDAAFSVLNKIGFSTTGYLLNCPNSSVFNISISSNSPTNDWVYSVPVSNINTGQWVHCVVVKNSSGILFFANNQQIATTEVNKTGTPDLSNTLALEVGRGATNSLFGSLDDLRIYKYALDATQISYLYNNGAGRKYAVGQIAVEPSFVMEFDADFVSDEIFTTVPLLEAESATQQFSQEDGGQYGATSGYRAVLFTPTTSFVPTSGSIHMKLYNFADTYEYRIEKTTNGIPNGEIVASGTYTHGGTGYAGPAWIDIILTATENCIAGETYAAIINTIDNVYNSIYFKVGASDGSHLAYVTSNWSNSIFYFDYKLAGKLLTPLVGTRTGGETGVSIQSGGVPFSVDGVTPDASANYTNSIGLEEAWCF
jgi:hypothetical protein